MKIVGMKGNTDIIRRMTEMKRRTGHTRRLGESEVSIL